MIPNKWKKETVKQFAKIGTGGKDTQNKVNGGKYPFYVRSATIERIDSYSFDGVAVLTVGDGVGTGKVFHFVEGKCEIHQRVYKISDYKEYVDPKYFFYYFSENFNQRVQTLSAKNSVDSVRMEMISEMEINIPPLNEQKKIAEILTSIDRVIELISIEIDKLKDLKKGMMQELLTKGIGHTKFKDSTVGKIPKSWEFVKLGDICDKIQDGTHFSPKTTEGPFKYITSKNIRFGYMDLANMSYISEEEHNEIYKRCNVQLGDVLLTKDGANTGNAAINILNEQFSLLSSVALLRCDEKSIHNMYLLNYLLSPFFQKFIQDAMTGNAITRITLTTLNGFKIPLPDYKEQIIIAKNLNSIDKNIFKKEEYLKNLNFTKKGLMNDLLTGKVRVKV